MKRWMICIAILLAVATVWNSFFIPAFAAEDENWDAGIAAAADMEQTIPTDETLPSEQETLPEETWIEETVPGETLPEETIPEETIPDETVPEETVPAEPEPLETQPEQEEEQVQVFTQNGILHNIPLYFQNDYTDCRYGHGTIATSGCGVTCLAMVANYMTGYDYTPDELAGYFGWRGNNNMQRLELGSTALGLSFTKNTNWHITKQAVAEGKIAIVLMDERSDFTDGQHFVVITGVSEDGKYFVNDPNRTNYDRSFLRTGFAEGFDEGVIIKGFCGGWVYDPTDVPADLPRYTEVIPESESRYPDIRLSPAEQDLLARVIWVEARGECFEGQQAIAEIVLNRMASEDFPNTLSGVIYAQGQFRSVPHLDDAEPTHTQYRAIELALSGPNILPKDVFYFATYPTNENEWGTIGGHIFCYQY